MKNDLLKEEKELEKEEARFHLRILDVICIAFVCVALLIGGEYIINEIFKKGYEEGKFNTAAEEVLYAIDFPSGYVPAYNLGNVSMKAGEYEEAGQYYQEALSHYIPEGRECSIRINYALSMIYRIDFTRLDSIKRIERAINELLAARAVLTEDNCASEKGSDGHSEEAEKLKRDIDRMLEQLMNTQTVSTEGSEEDEQQNEGQGEETEKEARSRRESQIEDELKARQRESMRQRSEADRSKMNGGDGYGESDIYRKSW